MIYRTDYDPEHLRPIVFRIRYSNVEHGTGFFVRPDGWALSCWHVIPRKCVADPSEPVDVEWPWYSQQKPNANVILRVKFQKDLSNEAKDIAVLKFDPLPSGEDFPALPMVAMAPKLLKDRGICARGFQETYRHPDSTEIFGSTNRHNAVRPIRIVDEKEQEIARQELLVIDPEGRNIEPGSSGGPIVETGSKNVIAIVTSRQRGQTWGYIESAGVISGGRIFIDEQYFREGYGIPLYEVFDKWPGFGQWCRLVGDVSVVSAPIEQRVGQYEELKEVGKGGFGTVFKTKQPGTDQVVALKRFEPILFRDEEREEAHQRFLRGARIMERLKHSHIPKVFEVNADEGYLVMEFAHGGSLQSFFESRTRLGQDVPFRARVEMSLQLCEAISHAHRQGVLHRDISPPNVLVDKPEALVPRLLLSDFDLAFQRGRTQLTGREWNWRYYLPRDLREELDKREQLDINAMSQLKLSRPGIEADLYSLAMVILYLFTNYEPGPEGVIAEIDRIRQIGREEKWCSAAQLEHLAQTLERALHPLSEKRFTSVEQFKKQLAYLLPPTQGDDEETMAFIGGGPFFMGSDDDRFPDESPRHLVRVSDFYLDLHPVTNADFKRFLDDEANADWRPGGKLAKKHALDSYLGHWDGLKYPPEKADHPVVNVSWHAARSYVEWAGKRLPTEAEWEYAARAGTETAYWWGNKADPQKANFYQAQKHGNSTTAVKSYPSNAWGLFDMLGNVAEWCSDWYADDYYRLGNDHDPSGPVGDDEKVFRGGSYESVADDIRCSARNKAGTRRCSSFIGFRCAKTASIH